jgi:triacylglycerol lipase
MTVDLTWKKPGINRQNAEFFGRAAHLAYNDPQVIEASLPELGLQLVKFFDCQNTQAYLAKNDQACVLAFRGTQPTILVDWLSDLDAHQVNGPVGKVHEGFLCALHYIWLDVWKTLQSERGMRSLWITGHSLGGALAVLAAAKLRFEKAQPINGVYTYGQPRVGDFEFCSRYDNGFGDYTFRFVNFKDIVPRVPFRTMNFYDLGQFFYFNENNYDPETTWGEILLRNVGRTIQQMVKKNGVTDHYMDNYLLKLKSLADFTNFHDM